MTLRWGAARSPGRGDAAGRALLASLAADLTGDDPDALRIGAAICPDCGRAHGAPLVTGARIPLHASLAHAAGWTVGVVAAAGPVGIDLELAPVSAGSSARRCGLPAGEGHNVGHMRDPASGSGPGAGESGDARAAERAAALGRMLGVRPEDALVRWTLVEAVLKADGRGLRVDPMRVHVRGPDADVRHDSTVVHDLDARETGESGRKSCTTEGAGAVPGAEAWAELDGRRYRVLHPAPGELGLPDGFVVSCARREPDTAAAPGGGATGPAAPSHPPR